MDALIKRLLIGTLLLNVFFAGAAVAEPVLLRWAVNSNASYKISSYVYEHRYLNSKYVDSLEIRNKALLKVDRVLSNSVRFNGKFFYYQRPLEATNRPFHLMQVYPSRFWRDERGKYRIADKYVMPVVRNVPVFPVKKIAPGHMWREKAWEVHDLSGYGMQRLLRIPIDVRYIYVGNERINGRQVAKFSITYVFTHLESSIDLDDFRKKMNRQLQRYRHNPSLYRRFYNRAGQRLHRYGLAPKRVTGSVIALYYWDIKRQLPYSMSEDFHFVFHLANGQVHEFKGKSAGRMTLIDPDNKAKKLVQDLNKRKFNGVSIRRDKRGVVLELRDLLFGFDRSDLRPEVRRRLQDLAKVLQKYKKYDIRVEGYTDNSGTKKYNLNLSKARAKTIARWLVKHAGTDPKRLAWIGKGEADPVAPNTTKAGRARNRRVEIVILTKE